MIEPKMMYNFFELVKELGYDVHEGDPSFWHIFTDENTEVFNGYCEKFDINYMANEYKVEDEDILKAEKIRELFKLIYQEYKIDYMYLLFEW